MSLWFQNADMIPIMVLAYNAHDCFHVLTTKDGKPSEFGNWLEAMPKSFQERTRYVVDFCKHGAKDTFDQTPHDPRVAEAFMYFAGRCYRELHGAPTPLMFAFDIRLCLENPDIVLPAARPIYAELERVDVSSRISREQFLKENLPIFRLVLSSAT